MAEAPRSPTEGVAAPPCCSHRTSAWLMNRVGCVPVMTTAWTFGSWSTRSTNSSSWLAISRPNKASGPPSTRTIRTAPRSSISKWPLSLCVMGSPFHRRPACLGNGRDPGDLPLESLRIREEGRPRALTHLVGKDLLVARDNARDDRLRGVRRRRLLERQHL